MAAARIGPQSAAVIFPICPTVQKDSAIVIGYENRERAMKLTVAVRVELESSTDWLIGLADKNY